MRNRYAGPCKDCGQTVDVGAHESAELFEESLRRIVTAPKPEKPVQEPKK